VQVIGNIFRKSLRLSGRVRAVFTHTLRIDISCQARLEHNAGKITTMISTDTTRLDFATTMVHMCVLTYLMGSLFTPEQALDIPNHGTSSLSHLIQLHLISQIDFRRGWSPC
jgi:hypothetical protein